MADLQDEMAIAQQEIEQANGALQKAVRERRAKTKKTVGVSVAVTPHQHPENNDGDVSRNA